ncbi:MAG: radical SAM protein [Thermodesulfobacteriota bacterium]
MKRFNLTPEEKAAKIARHIHPDFPAIVGIDVLRGRCNLRCRMCPMFNVRFDSVQWMEETTFTRILEEVSDRNTSIELSAMGEPLLHPRIRSLIRILGSRCRDNHTLLVTNGHYLDHEMIRLILDAGIQDIQISLNAYGEKNYQWLTGSSHYDRVVENIRNLVRMKEAFGNGRPRITTHIAGIREFQDDFVPFLEQWAPLVENARIREIKDWSGLTRNNGLHPLVADEIHCERYPCAWLWECMEFHPSGAAYACSFHSFFNTPPLGNILEESVNELWHGPSLDHIREEHIQGRAGEVDFCARCYNWYLYPNFWEKSGRAGKRSWRLPASEEKVDGQDLMRTGTQ